MHYRYKAHEAGVTDKIVDMGINGSGVRDTGSVLGISPTTVLTHSEKLNPPQVTPLPFDQVTDIELVCK